MKLTDRQWAIMYGTLLGDGYITKLDYGYATYYRFEVEHTINDKEYVDWLYKELSVIFNVEARVRHRYSSLDQRGIKSTSLSLYSKMHEIFRSLREETYPNNRKTVSQEWLDKLTPLSLAVWYMDDGTYHINRNTIEIYTNSFSLEEHHLMQRHFQQTWNISPTIVKRGKGQRKKYCLYFPRNEAVKLLHIIHPHILQCMRRKAPLGWERAIALPPNFHTRIKDHKCPDNQERIIENLQEFYNNAGRPNGFPVVLYNYTKGSYSYKAITAIFGSWFNALEAANLPTNFI